MKRGYLLLNLGTPDDPSPKAVARYLREFLMDKWVIDVPEPLRWLLVNALIVPKRKHDSSKLYRSIWTERGSPLLVHLEELAALVRMRLDGPLEIGMRYGSPSIFSAIGKLVAAGVEEIVVLALYPQYAESSTRTAFEACEKAKLDLGSKVRLNFIPAFYDREEFKSPLLESVQSVWQKEVPEHLLLSFHGLPERHIRRTDRSENRSHCLTAQGCCDKIVSANRDCYRAQSFATARDLATRLGLTNEDYTVSFQSRLGRSAWILPETEATIRALALRGVRRLAVACPSFVADCLETIEEIGVRAERVFREAGGNELIRIDCLNSNPAWADGVARMLAAQPS